MTIEPEVHSRLTLLSRIEDAGLNASAPPQQRWMDGWLLRFSRGKARRARCINAVAAGRMPWFDKLKLAHAFYTEQGLTLAIRITPFTLPSELDAELGALGYAAVDHTLVMVRHTFDAHAPALAALPPEAYRCEALGAVAFAEAVGMLRGSPPGQRAAHAERLLHAPVRSQRLVVRRNADDCIVACGQAVQENELVGLYDVQTHEDARRTGLATWLCAHLLARSVRDGAITAYLQVDAQNDAARRIYARLGFTDAYGYHYRQPA